MSGKNEQGKMDVTQKNVLNAPLHQHSTSPKSSSNLPPPIQTGLCTPTHPIAAILTTSFLDFSASQGTDLRRAGLGAGGRFCLDARMWKSAAEKGIEEVPRVKLEATHAKALDSVGLGELKRWAAAQEVDGRDGRVGRAEEGMGWARESGEIGGREPRA